MFLNQVYVNYANLVVKYTHGSADMHTPCQGSEMLCAEWGYYLRLFSRWHCSRPNGNFGALLLVNACYSLHYASFVISRPAAY
jgi:hypothetical protein